MSRFGLILALFVALSPSAAYAGKAEEAKAAKLFDQAEAEYQGGNFKKAIDLLLEAQRLAPDAVLHYNLARAYEGLGDLDPALASYRAYLEADPSSKDRGAVEARIKTLEQLKADREAKANPPPSQPPAQPDKPKAEPESPSAVPWVIAGVGALGLGAGGVLGGLSLMRTSDAEDPTTSGEDVVTLQDEAQTFATAANVTFAVSGAILAAGVIWGIVDVVSTTDGGDSPTSLRIEITTGGARLSGVF